MNAVGGRDAALKTTLKLFNDREQITEVVGPGKPTGNAKVEPIPETRVLPPTCSTG